MNSKVKKTILGLSIAIVIAAAGLYYYFKPVIVDNRVAETSPAKEAVIDPAAANPIAANETFDPNQTQSTAPASEPVKTEDSNKLNPYVMIRFEDGLVYELTKAGFTVPDAEKAFQEVKKSLEGTENLPLDSAKTEIAKKLSLKPKQINALSTAIARSMDDIGGPRSLSAWEKCLDKKIKAADLNSCDKGLVEEYRKAVQGNAENKELTFEARQKSLDLEYELVGKSIRECKRDLKTAVLIYTTDLGRCE